MTEDKTNETQLAQETQDSVTPKAETKLMGIPKTNYIKLTYALLMIASALNIIATFVTPISGLVGLIGLAGVVLALLGWFVYKLEFTDAQNSHFACVGIVFIASFVLGILLSIILGGMGAVALIISPLVNLLSLLVMFAGFRLNEKRMPATKENVLNEIKSLKP